MRVVSRPPSEPRPSRRSVAAALRRRRWWWWRRRWWRRRSGFLLRIAHHVPEERPERGAGDGAPDDGPGALTIGRVAGVVDRRAGRDASDRAADDATADGARAPFTVREVRAARQRQDSHQPPGKGAQSPHDRLLRCDGVAGATTGTQRAVTERVRGVKARAARRAA